jgi:hypothetical protein
MGRNMCRRHAIYCPYLAQQAFKLLVSDQSELVPFGPFLPPARSGWLNEAPAGVHLYENSSVEILRIFGKRYKPTHFLVRQTASGICLYAFHSQVFLLFYWIMILLLRI